MRAVLISFLLLSSGRAWAAMVPIASNGAWITLADTTSAVKVCAIQAEVGGGRLTLSGATDRQGVLRLSLYKSTWKITNVPVPIVLTFPGGNVVNLTGTGTQSIIRADVPAELVKPLIHYFTAFDTGTITLPEGHEAPWTLDLHGTTPATLAMAKCIDDVQLTLPPPFRPPVPLATSPPDVPVVGAPADGSTQPPQTQGADASSQPVQSAPVVAAPLAQPAATDASPLQLSTPNAELGKARAVDDSSVFLVVVFLLAVGGIAWAIMAFRLAEAKKARLLAAITDEINFNAQALRIKRLQTVQTDQYGTVQFGKWIAEREYYLTTRILPIVAASGFSKLPDGFSSMVSNMIEEASQRPLPAGYSMPDAFVSNPEVFDARMHPIDYEAFCALQLQKAGWDTRTTVSTGDQGADVIAKLNGKILVVQCKLYSGPVGNDAVQQAFSAKTFQGANFAAVVSNQPFTRSAKQLASTNGVYLLHHDELGSFRPAQLRAF